MVNCVFAAQALSQTQNNVSESQTGYQTRNLQRDALTIELQNSDDRENATVRPVSTCDVRTAISSLDMSLYIFNIYMN